MIWLSHWMNDSTPCYGGHQSNLNIEPASKLSEGATSNSLKIHLSNHVGTHIDFPSHFDKDGKTLSSYTPDELTFLSPQLIDLPLESEHMVSISDLENRIDTETDFLILRTGFERHRGNKAYWNNNPGVLPEVGFWLRDQFPKIRAIGFDFISLTCFQNRELGREAHRAFLNSYKKTSPILIVEDMKLSHMNKKLHHVILAPLLIENADGVPVTILAKETNLIHES